MTTITSIKSKLADRFHGGVRAVKNVGANAVASVRNKVGSMKKNAIDDALKFSYLRQTGGRPETKISNEDVRKVDMNSTEFTRWKTKSKIK